MAASDELTLDELIALNEEMAALARAGVPLDRALTDLGRDLGGRLGATASVVAQRLHRGEPLDKILADPKLHFPPIVQAIVQAGVRSGNLPLALERLATTLRRVRETRRLVGLSLMYPVAVLMLAIILFAVMTKYWAQPLFDAFENWRIAEFGLLRGMAQLGEYRWWWAPGILLTILALSGVWWRRSNRVARAQVSGRMAWQWPLPSLARLSKAGRMSAFTELLRLLIQHRVPLPEALVLAANASGDASLAASARRIAESLHQGQLAPKDEAAKAGISPILLWLLADQSNEARLESALKHLSHSYRQEAIQLEQWISIYLPLLFTAVLGGGAVFIYSLTVLGPVFYLFYEMGKP